MANENEPDLSHLNAKGPEGVTVGRIVHFVDAEFMGPVLRCALVVQVQPSLLLELHIPELNSYTARTTLVPNPPFSPTYKPGHWSWPPR